jgi:hypothetical protein
LVRVNLLLSKSGRICACGESKSCFKSFSGKYYKFIKGDARIKQQAFFLKKHLAFILARSFSSLPFFNFASIENRLTFRS